MIGTSERLVLFSVFLYILLCVNRLSVVIVWAFFLAMRLTTVSLDYLDQPDQFYHNNFNLVANRPFN